MISISPNSKIAAPLVRCHGNSSGGAVSFASSSPENDLKRGEQPGRVSALLSILGGFALAGLLVLGFLLYLTVVVG